MVSFNFKRFLRDLKVKQIGPIKFHRILQKKGVNVHESTVYNWFAERRTWSNISALIVGLQIMDRDFYEYVES